MIWNVIAEVRVFFFPDMGFSALAAASEVLASLADAREEAGEEADEEDDADEDSDDDDDDVSSSGSSGFSPSLSGS